MPVAQHYILKLYELNWTENDRRCNQSTHSFRIDLWLSAADRTHEQNVRIAGETADIQNW
jgi:hypothetical protein